MYRTLCKRRSQSDLHKYAWIFQKLPHLVRTSFTHQPFTGPQASFNIKAEAEAFGETMDLEDEVEKFDLGWTRPGTALSR